MSRFWARAFRIFYRIIGFLDPLIRAVWQRFGLGNVVELRVPSRRTGRQRSLMLGVLRAGNGLYLGHPNGTAGWTRDLDAAPSAELVLHGLPPLEFRATLLPDGAERTAVISATGQHPFPGNLVYRLARRHVLVVGRYYRLEPISSSEPKATTEPDPTTEPTATTEPEAPTRQVEQAPSR